MKYDLKIQISDNFGKSHVYINGQEIPVAYVTVEARGHELPRIELGMIGHYSQIEVEMGIESDIETSEVLEALVIEGGRIYKK
jgi:hypothetical protein